MKRTIALQIIAAIASLVMAAANSLAAPPTIYLVKTSEGSYKIEMPKGTMLSETEWKTEVGYMRSLKIDRAGLPATDAVVIESIDAGDHASRIDDKTVNVRFGSNIYTIDNKPDNGVALNITITPQGGAAFTFVGIGRDFPHPLDVTGGSGPDVYDDDDPQGGKDKKSDASAYISAIANANFIGNNKFLSNLTPIVNLGVIAPVKKYNRFSWDLDVNPYLGAQINTRDSVSFIPALMLYGRGGLLLNNYFSFELGKDRKTVLTLFPACFGLKFVPDLQDSNTVVIQHNFRSGIALRFSDIFLIGAQYTHGWHNLTSESERFYSKTFGTNVTDIDYLTVTGTFLINGKAQEQNNYVYFEWRGLLSKERFSSFTNNSILTIGLRKDISSLSPRVAAQKDGAKNAVQRRHQFL